MSRVAVHEQEFTRGEEKRVIKFAYAPSPTYRWGVMFQQDREVWRCECWFKAQSDAEFALPTLQQEAGDKPCAIAKHC